MKDYRSPDGERRLYFADDEIEQVMEDELRRAQLQPTLSDSVVDLDRLIERHLKADFDQYAELPADVLGQTDFRHVRKPAVQINKDLTGSAFDSEWCPPGIEGRWRATVAHEAAHIILHRMLFEVDDNQGSLFPTEGHAAPAQQLHRCLKRDVTHRAATSDWKEIQANKGMAALLMPKSVFTRAARRSGAGSATDSSLRDVVHSLATQFAVSRQAATIRLKTLQIIRDDQTELDIT